jgi:MFS family permease
MIIMIVFSVAVVLGLWIPGRNSSASIAFAFLFGIGSGACIGLGHVLNMSISPAKEVGYRMGTIFAVAGVGCLLSPPIGGAIIDRTRDVVTTTTLPFQWLELCAFAHLHHLAQGKTGRPEHHRQGLDWL